MADLHIEDFYRDVGGIFAQLRSALRSHSSIQIGRCVSYLLERHPVTG